MSFLSEQISLFSNEEPCRALAQEEECNALSILQNVPWMKLNDSLSTPHFEFWSPTMTDEAVDKQNFYKLIEWVSLPAQLEEQHRAVISPYEKNLEVWRQLWRVVERSDLVLFILDARNPLVFRCADFERYVRGTQNAAGEAKEVMYLLNKADLLTAAQRHSFVFFSARPASLNELRLGNEEEVELPSGPRVEDECLLGDMVIYVGSEEEEDSWWVDDRAFSSSLTSEYFTTPYLFDVDGDDYDDYGNNNGSFRGFDDPEIMSDEGGYTDGESVSSTDA